LALEFHGGEAGGWGLGVPIGAVIRRRVERLDAQGGFVQTHGLALGFHALMVAKEGSILKAQ